MIHVVKGVLLVVSALFPIVDPIGGSPIFLSLTLGYTTQTRRLLAWRIAVNSFILMVGSFAIGSHVLAFFGISLPVVQVGGGLIVVATGWAMLNKTEDGRSGAARAVNRTDVLGDAFYPLTLPLTVGPGTISVAITLGANVPHHVGTDLQALPVAVIGSALVAVSVFLCYGFADRMAAIVGPSGMNVILKLFSFLLVCIGGQILWNGVSKLVLSLR